MPQPHPKHLVVEDNDQKGAVIGLMRHHGVEWPQDENGWPVYIHVGNSAEEVLKRSTLSTRFKESGLQTLGIILDADEEFDARWQRIRAFCDDNFTRVPPQFPRQGLILQGSGTRFGAWVMPDNSSRGMIETFCMALVPSAAAQIWEAAVSSAAAARELGAPFRKVHTEKAQICTWLAWQDPPGERMGTAITRKILDPEAPSAAPFVAWFRELYEV